MLKQRRQYFRAEIYILRVSSNRRERKLYREFVKEAEIKVKCGTARCDIAIAPSDEDKRGLIADVFPDARITADPHIQIGGVKANCPELGILMDDTLDSRLEEQRRWFIETCSMKVV